MPWLSSSLPPYTGQYQVGAIEIEVPVESRNLGTAVFKDTRKPAFEIETVLFTLYYPTTDDAHTTQPHHPWVPKPMSLHAEGYARFAHISNFITNHIFTFSLWMLAGSTEIPALVDVPLYSPSTAYHDSDAPAFTDTQPRKVQPGEKFPVIIFSHGMASCRTSYSQYCGELASRGYIIAALEHRDGSGPGTTVTSPDGSERNVFHITPDQLHSDPPIDMPALKEAQLAFRQAEVDATVRVLRDLDSGRGSEVFTANLRREGKNLSDWKGTLNTESLTIAGHSFGATLALRTLKPAPSPSPFTAGIALDPGKSSGPLNADISVPLLVVHSQSWSARHSVFFGRPHFAVVRELVQGVNARGKAAWFLTSLGTTHPSVTDAPLIEPTLLSWSTGSTIEVTEGVGQYVAVSGEFLGFVAGGVRRGVLGEGVMSEEFEKEGVLERLQRMGRKIPGSVGRYWQVHVAPD